MNKLILILISIGLFSCEKPSQKEKSSITSKKERNELNTLNLPKVGTKIKGDFDGDGYNDIAFSIKTKEKQGNPIEGGTSGEYQIQFSDKNLKLINTECCYTRLINEGDLNNDGTDEISIYLEPINGCTYSMKTYSFIKGKWKQIINPFLIPTGCENISDLDLQKRIFKENNTIYYYDLDLNDESGKLVKKRIMIE